MKIFLKNIIFHNQQRLTDIKFHNLQLKIKVQLFLDSELFSFNLSWLKSSTSDNASMLGLPAE